MVATIKTVAFQGIEVLDIDVQVQIAGGLPAFQIVGLPDKTVAESKERVRSALHAIGLALPPKRLTVNLAPADVAKEGSHYDLPIALGLLAAMEVIDGHEINDYFAIGELGLDGALRRVYGVLPAAVHASSRDCGMLCPAACGGEAAWAGDLDILAPNSLLQLINHLKGSQVLTRPEAGIDQDNQTPPPDMANIRGQESARRALEIAAAGGHNMLMNGPPGAGKSMLAAAMPGIMPAMSARESLEVSMIHSLAGTLPEGGLITRRPYRDPHHSASQVALIGGGNKASPGEISLAHNGVLFLDELPEFQRTTLEALRQPLETGQAMVARANYHAVYPAQFQLVAAMNPCRCGYLGDPEMECNKAPRCGSDYSAKISGPLLDRMDIQTDVPAVSIAELGSGTYGEDSASIGARVQAVRDMQTARFAECADDSVRLNAQADGELLERIAPLDDSARTLLNDCAEQMRLSARAYYRILRLARTIADLEDVAGALSRQHMAEALSYRRMPRGATV